MFHGFTDETLPWFDGLLADNSRDYFTARRDVYERAVRGPLEALMTLLAGEFGGEVKLFRPNRDVRFTPDKSPYKTNASAVLIERPDTAAAMYVELSADGLHAASGYHAMTRDQLARFRAALTAGDKAAANGKSLRRLMEQAERHGVEVDTAPLRGMPRGIPKEAENADLARFTTLTVGSYLEPEKIGDASVRPWVARVWRAAQPLNAWLDEHVGAATEGERPI